MVWRDATTVQLGVSPPRAVVITGLQDGDDVLIAALDGLRDTAALRTLAGEVGLRERRVDELLRVLAAAGVLVGSSQQRPTSAERQDVARLGPARRERLAGDALVWSAVYPGRGDGLTLVAARTRRHVRVDGEGPVADALAATLVAAGVETLTRTDSGGPRPDVHVLVRRDAVDVCEADALLAADRVHLAVVTGGEQLVIGPLVLPGRSPCLRCLDLHRTDRDPAWPHVVAQLVQQAVPGPLPVETASATLAAGLAALQVLTHLDGQATPAAVGRTLEIVLPDGLVERRRWTAHPACGCQALAASRAFPGVLRSGAPMRPSVR